MKKSTMINLRLPNKLKMDLIRIAEENDISITKLINQVLKATVESMK